MPIEPDPFQRWPQLDGLFEQVLEQSPGERAAYLDHVCAGDGELREELERLVAAHADADAFLDDPDAWIGELRGEEALEATGQPDPFIDRTVSHYRIEQHIGAGGMGMVFRARDTRLDRDVALKFLHSGLVSDAGAKARFVQEAKAASALDHPNICTLYEIDETDDGRLFIAMAYYEGHTLAERIADGPLSVEECVVITAQIADGLARAHEAGIVHRDLKPANVMLTERGEVKILDFGIAKLEGSDTLTRTGVQLGTVAYMSPEQARGEHVDHRTDIWSLGVVLHEMLAGTRPFTGDSAAVVLYALSHADPPPVTASRNDVPPAVVQVIDRALAKDPDDRFAAAADVARELRSLGGGATNTAPRRASGKRRPRHRVLGVVSAIAALVVLVGGAGLLWPRDAIPFDERDWVLVTDFDNRTGDSLFDWSLHAAFTIGLQQSQHVNLFPRNRVAETLRRMRRDSMELIDAATGVEVALRENLRLVVAPSIDIVDSAYILTTRIVDPEIGVDLRSRSTRANGKGEVLGAVDGLVRQLRRDLGDARREVGDREVLQAVTTRSLEALRAWSEGNKHWGARRIHEAAASWQRAIELDSSFARAHQMLGGYYYWTTDRPSGDRHFDRALSLLDSVTERERLSIQAGISSWREDYGGAIQQLNLVLQRYPGDLAAWQNLGYSNMRLGQHRDAIVAYRQALMLDSSNAITLINMATNFSAGGDPDSALVYYAKAFEVMPSWRVSGNLNHEFGFTFVKRGDLDSAEAVFRELLAEEPQSRSFGHRSLGLLDMFAGKYRAAAVHLSEAIVSSRARAVWNSEYRNLLYRASAYRANRMNSALERDLSLATKIADESPVGVTWLAHLAQLRAWRGERVEVARLLDSIVARGDEGNVPDRMATELIRGELASLDGREEAALRSFELSYATRQEAHVGARLAEAYVEAARVEDAIETYLAVIERKDASLGWEAQEPWVRAHYRLAQLYEQVGDAEAALEFYGRLLDLWENADQDLPELVDARDRARELIGDRPRDH